MVKGKIIEDGGFIGGGNDLSVDVLNKLKVDGTLESLGKLFPGRQSEPVAVPILELSETNCEVNNANITLLGQIFAKEPKMLNMAKLWGISRRA